MVSMIQIENYDNNTSDVFYGARFLDQDFYPEFQIGQWYKHIQAVATKAGIIRRKRLLKVL